MVSQETDMISIATQFFHDLEKGKGSDEIKKYLADGATFQCDCLPQKTMIEYAEFMKAIISGPLPDFEYQIVSITSNHREVVFFANMSATHTGQGGPIPPSSPPLKTSSSYVYRVMFDDQLKITGIHKCFDIYTAFRKLNWPISD